MGYYKLFQSEKSQEFYFNLKAGNHETILSSEGYKDVDGARNGIASVQENSQDESKFEARESSNGKLYFVLKAGNGQEIGRSEMYESGSGMENGIESVMKNGASDEIKEDL